MVYHGLVSRAAVPVFLLLTAAAWGAPDRITGAVDPSRTSLLRGQVHRLAQARYDQGAADAAMELRYVTMLLQPAPGLGAFLAAPRAGRLEPEQFAERFGLSAGDIGKITAWLAAEGLRVNDVARGRHWITFSGSAEQVGRALHTPIHRYLVGGEMHFANAAEPSIPQALAGTVAGFRGLNDFKPVSALNRASLVKPAPEFSAAGEHYLAPGDLATIYDLTPLYNNNTNGTGVTIIIPGQTVVELSDIATFRELFRLPGNNPQPMLFGPNPGLSPGDLEEADLDLEVAGAAAPNASIIYAYSSDAVLAMQYAIDQNLGQVVSLSYGYCELDQSTAFEAVIQQANAQGITVMSGSGDSGAASCDEGDPTGQASSGATVSWPADYPEVTAVGGTEFNSSGAYWGSHNNSNGGSAVSYIPETTWNDSVAENGSWASGGGASVMFSKPPWQSGAGVPNDNARDVPDVAMAASTLYYAYLFVSGGEELVAGGTSASSPLFAGIVALLNQALVGNGTLSAPGLGNINRRCTGWRSRRPAHSTTSPPAITPSRACRAPAGAWTGWWDTTRGRATIWPRAWGRWTHQPSFQLDQRRRGGDHADAFAGHRGLERRGYVDGYGHGRGRDPIGPGRVPGGWSGRVRRGDAGERHSHARQHGGHGCGDLHHGRQPARLR